MFKKRASIKKAFLIGLLSIFVLYIILLIPGADQTITKGSDQLPFAWRQDNRWEELEKRFVEAKKRGCDTLAAQIDSGLTVGNFLIDSISAIPVNPEATVLSRLENNTFELAVSIAACPKYLAMFQSYVIKLRNTTKDQSMHWDMNSNTAQETIYRLLYGARGALEEIMLQQPTDSLPALMLCNDEPSATASTKILGATIHSGDILVSRGGAPTSALIARGNNFQGNFSHVALVYVDPKTNLASIIESHIEKGVAVASLESYLKDKKLRVMVLRLRHDCPALINDPMLPHKVAQMALQEALSHHTPYDFEMDSRDKSKMFCSEVVSTYYSLFGVSLWTKTSHISSPGVVSWLSRFGITHFDTQIPSDLEYDPQVQVVAEWRDIETLYRDHIDNAVIDAMLESADNGAKLEYDKYLLPIARILKLYSWILNQFDAVGPIPEGMNAQSALRNSRLTNRHKATVIRTLELAKNFHDTNGYRPPYWELLNLARKAKAEIDQN